MRCDAMVGKARGSSEGGASRVGTGEMAGTEILVCLYIYIYLRERFTCHEYDESMRVAWTRLWFSHAGGVLLFYLFPGWFSRECE